MPRRAHDAEFLRPGWFSVVQRVLPAVQQHSEFPRLVLPDGLSSPRWMISPSGNPTASPALQRGFLPNGRRLTAPPYDINYGATSSVATESRPNPATPTVSN